MASTCYNISLRPAVVLKNCLPVQIVCCVQSIVEQKLLEPGEVLQMPNVDPGQSTIVIRVCKLVLIKLLIYILDTLPEIKVEDCILLYKLIVLISKII